MEFNKFFTQSDYQNITNTNTKFDSSIHLVVAFPNIANVDNYIKKLYKFLFSNYNIGFKVFAWKCYTKRGKKTNNPHPRQKHLHIIIFLNGIPFSADSLKSSCGNYPDTRVIDIYDLNGVINYIHDGHHLLDSNYYSSLSSVASYFSL